MERLNKEKHTKKVNKKILRKENLLKIFLVMILIVIICITAKYIKKLNTENIENHNFYQYIAGRKIEYEGALKISAKGEITELNCTNMNIQLDSTPLYYNDQENKAMFPENMEIVIPNENGQVYKINRFSNIYMIDNVAFLEYRKKIKEMPDSFIYDGSNLYFFMDEATLKVEGKTYKISPLSYVVANNKNSIEIYNKREDKYKMIQTEEQGIVTTKDYTINVSLDTIKYGDKEQLLLKKIDELQAINMD